jgi:hypothetical protein
MRGFLPLSLRKADWVFGLPRLAADEFDFPGRLPILPQDTHVVCWSDVAGVRRHAVYAELNGGILASCLSK